ncbi:MAG: FAD-binding oxidoreductase [Vicinamibacterales bacterium]
MTMSAAIVAFVSSLHCGLLVLRHHRSTPGIRRWLLVLASALFAVQPWIAASLVELAAGLAVHLAWFLLTGLLARPAAGGRPPAPQATAPSTGAPRPAPRASTPPAGWVPLPVLAAFDETPDIRTFRLARPSDFTFSAGQFLPVRVRVDGRDEVRCYSISSAPSTTGFLEISVKRQGLVSGALHHTLRPGTTLAARAPSGHFVYPGGDDRPLVLLGAGVGITPLASMLRHALATDPQRPVTLVQGARDRRGLAYADEFRVLARRHPQFRWIPALSGEAAAPDCYPGRVDESLLATLLPELADAVTCICGPAAMIDQAREALAALGVPQGQVRFERFEAAVASVGAAAAEARAATDASGGAAASVHFTRSGVTHDAPVGASLLEAAEACGVAIPSLCRAGICGTCRTRADGAIECDAAAPDLSDGYVLACVSRITGACTAEA